MDEALEIIIRAWTEERFSFEGRHFRLRDVRMTPKPVQKPRQPIWVGRTGKAGARRVARFSLEEFCGGPMGADIYEHYLQQCREWGTEPKAEAQTLIFGHVHRDPEEAWREARPHAEYVHAKYQEWWWKFGDRTVFPNPVEDDFVIGDPAHWVERLRWLFEAQQAFCGLPPSIALVQLQLAGMPHEKVMSSMELFAKEVMPHFP